MLLRHKKYFSHFIPNMDGWQNIVAGDDDSSLEGSMETPLACRKMQKNESSCTSAMASFFRKKDMVLIILII